MRESLQEKLISSNVNMDLLNDAILAFAFENHSLDISPIDVEIAVKQKVPSGCLSRFLKNDLRDIHKIDYGLNYKIVNDRLIFNGVTERNLKGKTLVVQIRNISGKILKEIWIIGVSASGKNDEKFIVQDEREARGQGYEIF